MERIVRYFPSLTDNQKRQFEMLQPLYDEWNAKINVISRKDIGSLYEHHVLHSLAIGKALSFSPGTNILDLGTGGGFPGIPLAILFPDCRFTLIDGTGKKIRVATEVARALELENAEPLHRRGEDELRRYDFVVSRAVMPLPDLVRLIRKNVSTTSRNTIANGLLCLKGGDLQKEMKPFSRTATMTEITTWFDEEWFNGKYVVHVPL